MGYLHIINILEKCALVTFDILVRYARVILIYNESYFFSFAKGLRHEGEDSTYP